MGLVKDTSFEVEAFEKSVEVTRLARIIRKVQAVARWLQTGTHPAAIPAEFALQLTEAGVDTRAPVPHG